MIFHSYVSLPEGNPSATSYTTCQEEQRLIETQQGPKSVRTRLEENGAGMAGPKAIGAPGQTPWSLMFVLLGGWEIMLS